MLWVRPTQRAYAPDFKARGVEPMLESAHVFRRGMAASEPATTGTSVRVQVGGYTGATGGLRAGYAMP